MGGKERFWPVLISAGTYMAVFFGTFIILAMLLSASALIPKELLKRNMLSSASVLKENDDYYYELEGITGSRIDRYADAILLNIAWHFDQAKPLSSVMEASYYYVEDMPESDNLKVSVENDLPANRQYMRYWHGSAFIVRLMHLFTDIKGMYVFHAILLIVLTALLVYRLAAGGYGYAGMAVVLSLIGVGAWFVPFSLEYIWMFSVMLVISLLCVRMTVKHKEKYIPLLLMVSGIVAGYLDFLTTETLTFTVPLLLILYIRTKERRMDASDVRLTAVSSATWLAGYSFMWSGKWLLAKCILKTDVSRYVTEHIVHRLDGDVYSYSKPVIIVSSLLRNIKCIFPFEYGMTGVVIIMILLPAAAYRLYVYGNIKAADRKKVIIYLAMAMIPYLRYAVLHNHSFRHNLFTYRAQMATILALMFIAGEFTKERVKK
ncbi:MAG: hypothetical protein K6E63_08935 [Lachnospiraceae bacterium]|nr:hypothetical protein [Lachnospiraceae bacterium]